MDNYEEKIAIYQTRLEKYREVVTEMFNKPERQEYKKILLSPSNEEELDLANTFLAIFDDLEVIKEYASNDKLKKIDIKNSAIVNFIKTIYDKVKTTNLFDKIDLSDIEIDDETFANIIYEGTIIELTDSDALSGYVGELTENNLINILKLQSALQESSKIFITNSNNITSIKKTAEKVHTLFKNEISNLQDENDTIATKKLTSK